MCKRADPKRWLAISIFLLVFGGREAMAVAFVDGNIINGDFDYAYSVYAADVDGDGDMDILGASWEADDITWWENDGAPADGGWTEHTIDGDFDGAISVYAADVDRDGDLDVLGAASLADDIIWWENDGTPTDGGWTEHTIDGDFDWARRVYAADVDGDGDMDVLAAAYYADDITWWENDGAPADGGWNEHTIDGDFDGAISVYAADIDRDGDLDVLGAAANADDITWWENDGTPADGGWTEHTIDGDFDGAFSVYAADVDGDGDMDLLGAAANADDITWWENDGTPADGGWTEHTIDGDFDYVVSIYAADIDRDGDLDVLGASWEADDITWWKNDGTPADGGWKEHIIDGDFDGAVSVYAADMDGDGDLDVLGAASNDDEIAWWENIAITADLATDGEVGLADLGIFVEGWLTGVE